MLAGWLGFLVWVVVLVVVRYDAAMLSEWSKRIAAHSWSEAYVFFKHDEGIGSGPPAVDAFIKTFDSDHVEAPRELSML